MSPLDVSQAGLVSSAEEFDGWLRAHGAADRERWVDTQTKSIDDQRYAIRFVPRRAGSNWSATNREKARRLLAEGRMAPAGKALLPPDL